MEVKNKIFKKWGNWKDFKITVGSFETYKLIQVQEREDGKKRFKSANITSEHHQRPTTALALEDLMSNKDNKDLIEEFKKQKELLKKCSIN